MHTNEPHMKEQKRSQGDERMPPSEVLSIVVRRAAPSDNSAASALVFAILRSYGIEPDAQGLDADIAQLGLHEEPHKITFVAEHGGRVAGVATLDVSNEKAAFLSGLYVDPEARRLGIGRKLLSTAIETSRTLGRQAIRLETRERFAEAIRLYESTGWVRGEDLPPGYGPERTYMYDLTR